MAKQIRLTESDLKGIIRNSVTRYLKENADEVLDTPEMAIHAVHAADADRKKHTGRGKGSKDPEIRDKRKRQAGIFGDKAADLMNQEFNDPRFHVSGDRGARTMSYANDGKSAYLRPDMDDIGSAKLYSDDYVEGDEPLTLSSLSPEEYGDVDAMFNKFKGFHDRAEELDDKYLEESISRRTRKMLNEIYSDNSELLRTTYKQIISLCKMWDEAGEGDMISDEAQKVKGALYTALTTIENINGSHAKENVDNRNDGWF